MNKEIEDLIRQTVIHYHMQYTQYNLNSWDLYKLCVITGDCGHPDLPPGTITIGYYHPATFMHEARVEVLKIRPDFQCVCVVDKVNNVKFN